MTGFRHHPTLLHTTTTMSTTIVPAATKEGLSKTEVDARSIRSRDASSADDDDRLLVDQFGYVPSFKREFSSLATVCARTVSLSAPTLTHCPITRSVSRSALWASAPVLRRRSTRRCSQGALPP